MKNYVRPSMELNRFDAEDIIRTSGKVQPGTSSLSENSQSVIEAYNNNTATGNKIGADSKAVGFAW